MTGKRVLYQEPQATFFHDVMTNLFTDKMTKAATYYNLHPSNSELMSWGNNAPKIKDLLQLSGVTDTYVTFEYLVPYNMKRIDCILYGRNSQNQGNVVHIELKQWDNKGVRDTDCEGNFNVDDEDSDTTFQVQAYTGGGHRLVSHPSQQVRGYNDYLTGFIEVLSSKELHIEGLAYCYNYRKNKTPNTLFDEKYSELLQAYKTYAGDEVQELAQHLQQALGNGDGETIFHKMISSPIRPSKKLLESAANLIHEGNVSAFALIEEQIIARNVILDKIRKIGNKKSIIIVKGGPGTGKTVIALHILALLAGNKKSYNIRYATKSKPLLEGVKDRLPRGSKAKLLFSNVTQFIPANCEPNNIDVLLVDEAHRISNSANNQYTPTDKRTNLTQIQTIVQAAKISVFFIDDKQAIRSVEIGSSQLIRECAKEYKPQHDEMIADSYVGTLPFKLKKQMRKIFTLFLLLIPLWVQAQEDDAWNEADSTLTVTLGETSIGPYSPYKSKTIHVIIKAGTEETNIEASAFNAWPALKTAIIEDGVTSIGNDAFNGCKQLTSITIPSTMETIALRAFLECTLLEKVEIAMPSNITTIGESAFYNCSSLQSITIPAGIKTIETNTFTKSV